MQWFMKGYFEKEKEYQAMKDRGNPSTKRPSIYDDGLSVLAEKITKELGPNYTWKLMGPFGPQANSSLWFTKDGEDMLENGGYSLDVQPVYDEDHSVRFALAAGRTDFAGNPTKNFPMPESFEEIMCFLTRNGPISPETIKTVYSDVIAISKDDLFILKDMLQLTGDAIYEKYDKGDSAFAKLLANHKNIVYTSRFEDGKELDLEFAVNVGDEPAWLLVALYDSDGNLISEQQPERPHLAFPGEFNFVVDDILYSTSLGVDMEKCLYPAGLENISDIQKQHQAWLEPKKTDLNAQIQAATARSAESHTCSDAKSKTADHEH